MRPSKRQVVSKFCRHSQSIIWGCRFQQGQNGIKQAVRDQVLPATAGIWPKHQQSITCIIQYNIFIEFTILAQKSITFYLLIWCVHRTLALSVLGSCPAGLQLLQCLQDSTTVPSWSLIGQVLQDSTTAPIWSLTGQVVNQTSNLLSWLTSWLVGWLWVRWKTEFLCLKADALAIRPSNGIRLVESFLQVWYQCSISMGTVLQSSLPLSKLRKL